MHFLRCIRIIQPLSRDNENIIFETRHSSCGNSGFIEIGGAGMTHPEVLRRAGLDPEVYQSFAFGMIFTLNDS